MVLRRTIAVVILSSLLARAETVNPRVVERYKHMLAANPVAGVALDRLWKIAAEEGTTGKLIAEYEKSEGFAGQMILAHLLRKAARDEDAERAFERAVTLDPKSPLPLLELARIATGRTQPRAAADWLEKALGLIPPGDARMADTLLQLGSAWMAAGESGKATAAWERTLRFSPADTALHRRLADAYTEHLLPEAALKHLGFLADNAPPAERAAALQQIARLKSGLGKPGEAMQALERAVSITAPGNWLRPELLGEMIRLAQRQHAEEALEAKWKAQAEQNPHDPGAKLQLIEFYERTGKLGEQRALLEKVTAELPKDTALRLKLARLLVQLDDTTRAAQVLDGLIAAQPADVSLVFERAHLDVLREDTAAAQGRIAAIIAKDPGDETLRQKALDFYRQHRMLSLIESHLDADAAPGGEDPVITLANFFFAQRRPAEGLAALKRLIRPTDPPERRAAMHLRAAQVLKGHGDISSAIAEAREAIALQPGVREGWLLAGELEMERSRYMQAREAFLKTYALSGDDAARMEADGRLFETFRVENKDAIEDAPQRSRNLMAARVEGFIRGLMDNARERGDAAGWLRVARWKAWNNDKSSAVTFATKAAEIEPDNPKPREFLAQHLAAHGDPASALEHLRTLARINPAARDGYLRQIAQLELQRGNNRESLDVLTRLSRANPGDPDILSDLAGTLERAGKLGEAAASWRNVLSLAPPPRKREATASLLRVLQRLSRHEEAAILLLRTVDETKDEKERFARFDELLLHAREHGQLEWLRGKIEERRTLRADDYFTTVALGRVMKLLGEKTAAFELFADAVFYAPDQSAALPELVREAEALRRMDTAVRLQEQLTRVTSESRPDALLKLAALYRDTGDLDGWERTWARATAKFPRDVDVLRGASEFHREWGDAGRAATLLRKLLALEPANLRAASDLGELEFQAGNAEGAQRAFETVMRLTKPVKQRLYPADTAGGPWTTGGAQSGKHTSLAARVATARPKDWRIQATSENSRPGPDDEMRLAAMRRLAMLAAKAGGATLTRWIADWKPSFAAQPTETLWALYFSGARDEVLAHIGDAMRAEPQVIAHRQAFLWISLESRQFARIGAWLAAAERTAGDYSDFSTAFAAFVKAQPDAVGKAMIEGLFPRGPETRLWPSAVELARSRHFDAAIDLGMRALELMPTHRPFLGTEIARWHLAAGKPEGARAMLEQAAGGGGDSFESPVFGAMRDLYALLPQDERAGFVAARLKAADPSTLLGMMTRVTHFVLAGRDSDAALELDRILAMRPSGLPGFDPANSIQRNAAIREWLFTLGASGRLIEWSQPQLALRVLDHALADRGLVELQQKAKVLEKVPFVDGGHNNMWATNTALAELIKSARNQRDLLRFLTGGPTERAGVILTRRQNAVDRLDEFAETLEWFRAPSARLDVFLSVWNRDRSDSSLIRKVLDAAEAAGDEEQAERIRRVCLEEKKLRAGDNSPREFAIEVADLQSQRGALDEAIETTRAALIGAPADFRLLQKRMLLLDRAGRRAEADALLGKLASLATGDAQSRNALALRLELRGDFARAADVRLLGGGGGDPQLPLVLYKNGQTDEALPALDRLGGNYAAYSAMTLAEAMGLRGDAKGARGVLIATASRVIDPRSQMQLRSKLLTIPGAPPAPALVSRMQERLRDIAGAQPELADGYYEFFDRHADRFGIRPAWEQEVARTWEGGKGPVAAGVIALRHRLAAGDAAGAAGICEKMAARTDVTGIAATLDRLDAEIAGTRHATLRLPIAEAQARRGWPFAQATFDWVRLLDELGQRERARSVLDQHSWLAGTDGGAAKLGQAWLLLDDPEKARFFFRAALARESLSPQPSILAGMARVHIATKRMEAARLLLRRAFANPACREQAALVEYLDAAGSIGRWREVAAEFGLPPAAQFRLGAAMFAHFERHDRLGDSLALVLAQPHLVAPFGTAGPDPFPAVTCARIRALARKTGGFADAARALETFAAANVPDAKAEIAALSADRAVSAGESPVAHLAEAADLEPSRWEFARRLAEARIATGALAEARKVLQRFFASSLDATDREPAFDLWEKAAAIP